VRVLPTQVAHEAITASGARPRGERPPKLFRPERLTSLGDMVPLLRNAQPVILHVDRLDARDRLRALDVATGIATALDATVSTLETTPGVSIVPRCLQTPVPGADAEADADKADADIDIDIDVKAVKREAPQSTRTDAKRVGALCVFCELRNATVEREPPIDVVVMRDGSRARPPSIGLCRRCSGAVRNWRFTIAWCSTCEQWGRRGVRSSCGLAYGT
jgi:hypothetical protein